MARRKAKLPKVERKGLDVVRKRKKKWERKRQKVVRAGNQGEVGREGEGGEGGGESGSGEGKLEWARGEEREGMDRMNKMGIERFMTSEEEEAQSISQRME